MREFLSGIIMPLSIFWIILFAGLIFRLFNKLRFSNGLIFLAVLWMFCISTSFLPNFLIKQMESRYSPLMQMDSLAMKPNLNIMVLGSGHSDDKTLPPNNQLSLTALGRLSEGIRLHRLLPGSKLIVSGFSGKMSLSQAEVMKNTAISLGVDEADIQLLTTTRNTNDEAQTCFSAFGNQIPLILVTDAVHMPRAMMLFKRAGLNPVPSSTNNFIKQGSVERVFSWLPSSINIQKMEAVMHEYAGILWLLLGGK
jgi:uncharacterized SAM-binding protein YcdF (DUF218 family)